MLKTESLVTDVLVIGSGIAGMIAAIEARKGGAQVVLVSKAALGKEASTSYAHTFGMRYVEEPSTKEIPGYDNRSGKHIEDWAVVRAIIEEAPRQIQNLISLGVPMVMTPDPQDGVPSWRPQGSDRTHGGGLVLDMLASVAHKMGIRTVEGCSITGLLKTGDRVIGASGLMLEDVWLTVHSRAVILATGGAAGMCRITTTSKQVAGNGYAMALKAGLPLVNVEFNQFYPVGLPTPTGRYVHGTPATLMLSNALLVNDRREDIVEKHFGISLQKAILPISVRFDWIPRAVSAELETGQVWLDLTRVPSEELDRLPERNWKLIRQTKVDVRKTPLSIMPLSHASRGGVPTDTGMKTSLKGLYAAGEVVAGWKAGEWGLGNLPACLAMGAIAGRRAAGEADGVAAPVGKTDDEGLRRAESLLGRDGQTKPEDVCEEIRNVVYSHAGPIKSEASLTAGLRKLELLARQCDRFQCQNMRELKHALEAEAMLLVSEAMLRAALLRRESRGGFYRSDYPTRDDHMWLRPVVVRYEPNSSELTAKLGETMAPYTV